MSDAAYYRQEARRCREQAAAAKDPRAAQQWMRLAADNSALAALVDEGGPIPSLAVPNVQPAQQQRDGNDGT